MLDLAIRVIAEGAGTAAADIRKIDGAIQSVERSAAKTEGPLSKIAQAIGGQHSKTVDLVRSTQQLEQTSAKMSGTLSAEARAWSEATAAKLRADLGIKDLYSDLDRLEAKTNNLSRTTLPGFISSMGLTTTGAVALGGAVAAVTAAGVAWGALLVTSTRHFFDNAESMKRNRDALENLTDAWGDFKMAIGESVLGEDFSIVKPVKMLELALALVGSRIAANIDLVQQWIDKLKGLPGIGAGLGLADWMFSKTDDSAFSRDYSMGVSPNEKARGFYNTYAGKLAPTGLARELGGPTALDRELDAWIKTRDSEAKRAAAQRQREIDAEINWQMAGYRSMTQPRTPEAVRTGVYGLNYWDMAESFGWTGGDNPFNNPNTFTRWQPRMSAYDTTHGLGPGLTAAQLPSSALMLSSVQGLGQRGPGFLGSIFGSDFGGMMGRNVLSAVTGGGSIAGAIGGTLGMSTGSHLAGILTGGLGTKIGGVAGGALNAILPGAGALLGPALGWLGGKLFGPTAYETRERQAAKDIGGMIGGVETQFGGYEGAKAVADAMGIQWDHTRSMKGGGSVDPVRAQVEKIAAGSTDALNSILSAALTTGKAFPSALQPALESLIQMGGLTQENANLLRGLPAAGVPSMAQIEAAAATLNVEVGALGDKVKQIGLTETAEEAAQAWLTLERAGADMSAVAAASAEQMQGYVDQALKYGFSLPESLRPGLEKMREMGLVSGDLEQIDWAKPITDSVKDLVEALRELIAEMRGIPAEAAGAVSNLPSTPGPAGARGDRTLDGSEVGPGFVEYGGAQAGGGEYFVSRPTVFLAGEAGPESVRFSRNARSGGDGAMLLPVTIEMAGEPAWKGLVKVAMRHRRA